ncbi:MAG: hypothetical protein ABEJ83_00225 [Candidatus Nanohaloarchaea archaeon]
MSQNSPVLKNYKVPIEGEIDQSSLYSLAETLGRTETVLNNQELYPDRKISYELNSAEKVYSEWMNFFETSEKMSLNGDTAWKWIQYRERTRSQRLTTKTDLNAGRESSYHPEYEAVTLLLQLHSRLEEAERERFTTAVTEDSPLQVVIDTLEGLKPGFREEELEPKGI